MEEKDKTTTSDVDSVATKELPPKDENTACCEEVLSANTPLIPACDSLIEQELQPATDREETTPDTLNENETASKVKDFVCGRKEEIKKAAKAIEATQEVKRNKKPPKGDIEWQENADSLDNDLMAKSEGAYIGIANKIVDSATKQLDEQNTSKNSLKKTFTIFFVVLLSMQYVVLAVLLFIRTFQCWSLLNDTVIITYISSVFLETLGAVILMIRYAFDSKQETQVLEILNSIISRYQKFPKQ